MTTDLSQHYLHNDLHSQQKDPPFPTAKAEGFPTAKAGYTTAYWVAAGAGVLIATGVAAFTSFNHAPEPPAGSAQTVPLLATESESVANAVFGDEAQELAESDDTEVSEAEASPSAAPRVSPAGLPRAAEPGLEEAPSPGAPSLAEPLAAGAPPAADALVPATAGAFYVQIASYRTKETADTHAQALASRGFSAQSVAYGGPAAGWWHAVRLGPFEDRAAAEKSRFDLEVADRRAAYVLPRSNGKFHVQVASFAEQEEAEQVAKSLSSNGHATKVTRVKMSGSYWHCVRIGPFDTREEAVAYKALVPDVPGSQSTVIPFPPPPAR
ncbi:MAG TPA: SPOR domain-containing protein [Polyangiaceae bacterium]|nr:SPOR domain-containing protein [Polyangiaceae bacterium]